MLENLTQSGDGDFSAAERKSGRVQSAAWQSPQNLEEIQRLTFFRSAAPGEAFGSDATIRWRLLPVTSLLPMGSPASKNTSSLNLVSAQSRHCNPS